MLQSQSMERIQTSSNSDDTLLTMILRSPLNQFKIDFLLQICRILIYLLVSITIFSVFYRSVNFRFFQENYFSSDEIFFDKNMRGMFPSLSGRPFDLHGNWKFSYKSSTDNYDFKSYNITFQKSGILRVKRENCEGNYPLKWVAYDYNINLWQENYSEQNDILPDQKDLDCISEGKMIEILKKICIWTIDNDELYLIIQEKKNNSLEMSALGFTKQ